MTIGPGGQMAAVLRGQACSAHTESPPHTAYLFSKAGIYHAARSKCSKGTLSFLFSS